MNEHPSGGHTGRPPSSAGPSAESAATLRWAANLPLIVAGSLSIVAGGLVAAVSGPADWEHGSWVAAFLVLVAGVAQIGVAAGQAHLAPVARHVGFVVVEGAAWNVAGLTVIAGTLRSSPVIVSVGSGVLVVALAMSAFAVAGSSHPNRLMLRSFRLMLVVLLVSVSVGIALAWIRH